MVTGTWWLASLWVVQYTLGVVSSVPQGLYVVFFCVFFFSVGTSNIPNLPPRWFLVGFGIPETWLCCEYQCQHPPRPAKIVVPATRPERRQKGFQWLKGGGVNVVNVREA